MEYKPGRELDALVAESVMEWKHIADSEHWAIGWNGSSISDADREHPVRAYEDFKPSTDIKVAWEVVEVMKARGFKLELREDATGSIANFYNEEGDAWSMEYSTAPHAICLAALKAVGAI